MQRMVFLLEKQINKEEEQAFINRLWKRKVEVSFCGADESVIDDFETLMITDSDKTYERLKTLGIEPLVLIYEVEEMDLFPAARFFVMDFGEAQYDYFLKIWQRIRNLPWEMINTKRLLLRETVESDVDEFVKIYKDPEMTMYNEPLYEDPEAEKNYVTQYRQKVYAVSGFGVWTVVKKDDGAIIGRAGLSVRAGFEGVELGFAIATEYQNQGFAKESIRAILDFAATNELGNVYALVMPENVKSIGLLSKLGFKAGKSEIIDNTFYTVYTQFVNNLACS